MLYQYITLHGVFITFWYYMGGGGGGYLIVTALPPSISQYS